MLKIFVSSTFIDLEKFRRRVSDAIRRAKHDDIAMEYYVAEDKRPVNRCLEDVAKCDIYIGIFAWRRGWVPTTSNPEGLSITEMEYREAVSSRKPCLIFLLDSKVPWPPAFVDDDKTRIAELRETLAERHGGARFRSIDDLACKVVEALHKWEKDVGISSPRPDSHSHDRHRSAQYLEELSSTSGFDVTAVDTFRKLLRPECRREFPLSMEAQFFLTRTGVMVNHSLTRTGVLLFRDEPAAELVSAYLQGVKFDGQDKKQRVTAEDIHGSVYTQISGALGFVRQHTRHVEYFAPGIGRTVRVDQYPMKCLREVLANAVCHRDYRNAERCIQLRIFSDRLEILSPGEWMGAKQLVHQVDLFEMRSESIARNPVLARLLTWIKYVERQGSGIDRALADCTAMEAPAPVIEQRDGYVVVTVFPSDRFCRTEKGVALDDASPNKVELSAALEEEQSAFVNSRNSMSEKLDALRQIGLQNARSACRLLANLPELEPEATMGFLRKQSGWDGEDLTKYVSNWLYMGHSEHDFLTLLLEYVRSSKDSKTLAYVFYALLGNRILITAEEFFSACWHLAPDSLKIKTINIPTHGQGVTFKMGSEYGDAPPGEQPAHNVELRTYSIGVTPVTCAEYGVFAAKPSRKDVPVVSVTWWESWIFCRWIGGDLPTEAQWECACRAGTTTRWWFGDDARDLSQFAWVDEGDDGDPHPVGQKQPNPWGLHDVHGNVSEWCLDRYGPYVAGNQVNPRGPESGPTRTLRGGNAAAPPDMSRSARRDYALPGSTSLITGFRVAFTSSDD